MTLPVAPQLDWFADSEWLRQDGIRGSVFERLSARNARPDGLVIDLENDGALDPSIMADYPWESRYIEIRAAANEFCGQRGWTPIPIGGYGIGDSNPWNDIDPLQRKATIALAEKNVLKLFAFVAWPTYWHAGDESQRQQRLQRMRDQAAWFRSAIVKNRPKIVAVHSPHSMGEVALGLHAPAEFAKMVTDCRDFTDGRCCWDEFSKIAELIAKPAVSADDAPIVDMAIRNKIYGALLIETAAKQYERIVLKGGM